MKREGAFMKAKETLAA
jgi:hypothetical protein